MITAEQIVQARELLGWTRNDLRRNAGLNPEKIKAVESGQIAGAGSVVRHRVIAALEDAGVVFGADGVALLQGKAGVPLRARGRHE